MDTSNKDAWVSEKIKKIIAEGINGESVSQDQAVAVANRMWEEMQKSRMGRMPVLPSKPSKTVDGREINQKLIDAVVSYDPSKRPAILKLNQKDAHGNENSEVLATFNRFYPEGDLIYGEFTPTNGLEEYLKRVAAHNGPYPFRSIEADNLTIDGQERLWIESVALVGAQKAAIQNLPPAEFSAGGSKIKFTFSLTGEENIMETTAKPDASDKVDLAKIKSDLETEFTKQREADKAEFAKQIESERAARLAIEADLNKQKMREYFSTKLARKVRSTEREDLIALALALPGDNKITLAKGEVSLRDAFIASLEARPDVVPKSEEKGAGLNSEFQQEPADSFEAVQKFAKENNIDMSTLEGLEKAEKGAKGKYAAAFAGVK